MIVDYGAHAALAIAQAVERRSGAPGLAQRAGWQRPVCNRATTHATQRREAHGIVAADLVCVYRNVCVGTRRAIVGASERVGAGKSMPTQDWPSPTMLDVYGRREVGGESGQGAAFSVGHKAEVGARRRGAVVGRVLLASLGVARGDVWCRRIRPRGARCGSQRLHVQVARPGRTRGSAPSDGRSRKAGGVLERVRWRFGGRRTPHWKAHCVFLERPMRDDEGRCCCDVATRDVPEE